MSITVEPVRIANGFDEEGMLIFDGQRRLVAVLTHLSDEDEVAPGQWYLEAGFGRLESVDHPVFANLSTAQEWIRSRLGTER